MEHCTIEGRWHGLWYTNKNTKEKRRDWVDGRDQRFHIVLDILHGQCPYLCKRRSVEWLQWFQWASAPPNRPVPLANLTKEVTPPLPPPNRPVPLVKLTEETTPSPPPKSTLPFPPAPKPLQLQLPPPPPVERMYLRWLKSGWLLGESCQWRWTREEMKKACTKLHDTGGVNVQNALPFKHLAAQRGLESEGCWKLAKVNHLEAATMTNNIWSAVNKMNGDECTLICKRTS